MIFYKLFFGIMGLLCIYYGEYGLAVICGIMVAMYSIPDTNRRKIR